MIHIIFATLHIEDKFIEKNIYRIYYRMDYLKKKEELENKINEINTYWKELATDYQKELKKRHDEYQEDKPIKKANGHIFYTTKKLYQEHANACR